MILGLFLISTIAVFKSVSAAASAVNLEARFSTSRGWLTEVIYEGDNCDETRTPLAITIMRGSAACHSSEGGSYDYFCDNGDYKLRYYSAPRCQKADLTDTYEAYPDNSCSVIGNEWSGYPLTSSHRSKLVCSNDYPGEMRIYNAMQDRTRDVNAPPMITFKEVVYDGDGCEDYHTIRTVSYSRVFASNTTTSMSGNGHPMTVMTECAGKKGMNVVAMVDNEVVSVSFDVSQSESNCHFDPPDTYNPTGTSVRSSCVGVNPHLKTELGLKERILPTAHPDLSADYIPFLGFESGDCSGSPLINAFQKADSCAYVEDLQVYIKLSASATSGSMISVGSDCYNQRPIAYGNGDSCISGSAAAVMGVGSFQMPGPLRGLDWRSVVHQDSMYIPTNVNGEIAEQYMIHPLPVGCTPTQEEHVQSMTLSCFRGHVIQRNFRDQNCQELYSLNDVNSVAEDQPYCMNPVHNPKTPRPFGFSKLQEHVTITTLKFYSKNNCYQSTYGDSNEPVLICDV